MSKSNFSVIQANLAKRYAREKRFKFYGIASVLFGMVCLALLFTSIIGKGYSAFQQTYIRLDVSFDPDLLNLSAPDNPDSWQNANYAAVYKTALRTRFPDVTRRQEKKRLYGLLSSGTDIQIKSLLTANPDWLGQRRPVWLLADDDIDTLVKGKIDRNVPEHDRRINDQQIAWIDQLAARGDVTLKFNRLFWAQGDSREPELAGIWAAVKGSFYTLLVTLLLSFPIGVAAAIYLEEFAPQNRWTDLIEVNINNLAAVPSIVFGLLGLAIFINLLHLPRSAPLVGGMVLALMTLPTIIISGRAALKAVPPSIREAALGMGASRMQTIFHHVLPLAMPGMLTGTIIGMAQALGESAPLLMIGMVAFIVDVPQGLTDPSTVLPVQIYLWSDSPERGFIEKTSAAIMVLLGFLILMNGLAVYLRKKFERRW